jgi:two-component system nitrogen regulation response regulator NtrX
VDANEVPLKVLTVGAQNALRNLDWHGNLPVLQNAVKTLALTALGAEIGGDDVARVAREFSLLPRDQPPTEVGVSLDMPLRDAREQFERQYFMHHVGLERTHLYRKLKQLGIRPSSRGEEPPA